MSNEIKYRGISGFYLVLSNDMIKIYKLNMGFESIVFEIIDGCEMGASGFLKNMCQE